LLEATAGSVAYSQLPKSRQDLWTRFAPENIPVYTLGGWAKGSGLGGFPRTETGILKFGFRGVKYTNYADVSSGYGSASARVSVPKTKYTADSETRITKEAMVAIKSFVTSNLPELTAFGISGVRNCWYTDSIDNDFIISRVPSLGGLIVCSGGSGHGFKFLPILGRAVVRIIESRSNEDLNEYGKKWQWREKRPGEDRNGLEEGENGPRVWEKAAMATERDYRFDDQEKPRSKL
jgi:sarcosine oxidase/L-pipecolate oxidase